MRGFPKVLATPEDINNVSQLYPDETSAYVQALLTAVAAESSVEMSDLDIAAVVEANPEGRLAQLELVDVNTINAITNGSMTILGNGHSPGQEPSALVG